MSFYVRLQRWPKGCAPSEFLLHAPLRAPASRDYHEKDEFTVADFIEGLRFVWGELHSLPITSAVAGSKRASLSANGTVRLETIGRGKAALA